MIKISIVTNEELVNIRNKIGYYFEGGSGYISKSLKLNGSVSHLSQIQMMSFAKVVEEAPVQDKIDLEKYIENRMSEYENEILKLHESIKLRKVHIKNMEKYLENIKNLSSFEQTFNYLADEKNTM